MNVAIKNDSSDSEILDNAGLRTALDKGIDDMEVGRLIPLDESLRLFDEFIAEEERFYATV